MQIQRRLAAPQRGGVLLSRVRLGHYPPPAVRGEAGRAVGRLSTPSMADEHGVAIAIQGLVQGDGIGDQRAEPIAGVVGDRCRRVAAQERRDPMKAHLGQRGQQVPPGVGA